MKFYVPLKDILLGPGKRFDPAVNTETEVIEFINQQAQALDLGIEAGYDAQLRGRAGATT